jgi:hypothetical protein
MEEQDLAERVMQAANVLRWLLKVDEARAVAVFAKFLRERGVRTIQELNMESLAFEGDDKE